MNIDEAIAHARQVAEECPGRQCGYQHSELADWLEELKAYRETELTPEDVQDFMGRFRTVAELGGFIKQHDVDHLRELVQAEAEGRLVVLPCKAGDTLWTFCTYPCAEIYSFQVRDISTLNGRTMLNTDHLSVIPASDVGKTVFLTREEAEAAMQEEVV